jgi:hypothetical protein
MRRLTIGLTAAVMLLALAPSGAPASDNGSRHVRTVEHARVVRFGAGMLTITLRNGSILRGAVNRTTEIECTAPERMEIRHDGDQAVNGGPSVRTDANDDNEAVEARENEAAEPRDNDAANRRENEAAEPAENHGADPAENDVEKRCSTANLTPGRVVREAELKISRSGRVWKKVELDL